VEIRFLVPGHLAPILRSRMARMGFCVVVPELERPRSGRSLVTPLRIRVLDARADSSQPGCLAKSIEPRCIAG